MLEAVATDLVFTISLKRSTQNLQLSTSWPADYPISALNSGVEADMPGGRSRAISGCEQSQQGSPYSITSSARGSSVGRTTPSDFAVFAIHILELPLITLAKTSQMPWDGHAASMHRHLCGND